MNGIFDSITELFVDKEEQKPYPDYSQAERAVSYFLQVNNSFPNAEKMSTAEFIKYADNLMPAGQSQAKQPFMEHFGKQLAIADFEEDRIKSAMTKLANVYQGRIPTRNQLLDFGRALQDEFDTISYNMQLWGNALSETAAEFGDIGKSFIKYGPWLWIGAAGLGIMLLAWRSGGAVKSLARRAKSGF
jgi:hypothetical protein